MIKIINLLLLSQIGLCLSYGQAVKGASPLSSPPRLPSNIPPPPSFASISSKAGKFQIVSAEYYSQDPKPQMHQLSDFLSKMRICDFFELKIMTVDIETFDI